MPPERAGTRHAVAGAGQIPPQFWVNRGKRSRPGFPQGVALRKIPASCPPGIPRCFAPGRCPRGIPDRVAVRTFRPPPRFFPAALACGSGRVLNGHRPLKWSVCDAAPSGRRPPGAVANRGSAKHFAPGGWDWLATSSLLSRGAFARPPCKSRMGAITHDPAVRLRGRSEMFPCGGWGVLDGIRSVCRLRSSATAGPAGFA